MPASLVFPAIGGGIILTVTRRQLAGAGASLAWAFSAQAQPASPARRDTLVIGLDIADVVSLDPARLVSYTSPLPLEAAYDTLVTMRPNQYRGVVPRLAREWARLPDGSGWRFTLDPAATFATGNRVTAEDCRFSLARAARAMDGAGQFVTNIREVVASSPDAVDLRLHRPDEAILHTLASPMFGVLEKAVVENQNRAGDSTEWLNQNSAGSGPFVITGWTRRRSIQLDANPRSWRSKPGFRRVVIAHMPYPAVQLRAMQRGDIDAAFNLIPEGIAALQSDRTVRIETLRSLDFVYLALTADPALNPALAKPDVRRAIGKAIDYEDLLGRLLGGSAIRPAHFLPIGVPGSTEAVAARLGFGQDLARARTLLSQADLADGFEMELAYGDDSIAGVTYHAIARKLQTDLARIGVKLRLRMTNPLTLRADFVAGKLQAAIAFWHPPVIENRVWAEAAVERVGRRCGWAEPNKVQTVIADAAAAPDPARADALWADYQSAMVEQANLIVLFQPSYQVAVRNTVKPFPLTAAGWMADLGDAKMA